MMKCKSKPAYTLSPFCVLIDNNENLPYGFHAIIEYGNVPVTVETKSVSLYTGDYSIEGHQNNISVERKSVEDLYSTLVRRRQPFCNELQRLCDMKAAAVVVEGTLNDICYNPPEFTTVNPRSIFGSILAFMQRYRGCHWIFAGNRKMGAEVTYRFLERYWKDLHKNEGKI